MFDNYLATSTATHEGFTDENYRLPSNTVFDVTANSVTGAWTSTNTIANAGLVGYNDGLQVGGNTNTQLWYPSYNYSNTNITYTEATVNYSGGTCTGTRTYYRFFNVGTGHGNFTLTVNGNASPVSYGTTLSGNKIIIMFKLPDYLGGSGNGTDWLDVTQPFKTGYWALGNGCLNTGLFAMNTAETITVGTKNTGSFGVNGIVLLSITAPANWTGYLTSITLVGA